MPYDFTLMRFPRPTQPDLEAENQGPQPIQRGQVRQMLNGMPALHASADGRTYSADPADGPHIEIHIDPRDPPEFITVEFDRYASQSDYTTARALVDEICTALRLTITDDPDSGGSPEPAPTSGGGLLDRLRGMFGR